MANITLTSIVPWLNVRNSIKALAFYKSAFEAMETFHLDGDDGSIVAKLSIAGAEFWIGEESSDAGNTSPQSLNGTSVRIILSVDNPDEVFAKALHAGASEIFPIGEEHGWRLGKLIDPFGHCWEIGKPV